MTILIDLTSLSYHLTGIERYALCIAEKMIEIDQDSQYILLFRDEIYEGLRAKIDGNRVKAEVIHGNNKILFNLFQLPIHLYKIEADVYLFLAITSPLLFLKKGIVTTMHDMAVWDFPSAFSVIKRVYFKFHARISLKSAEKIITVSNFSKERIHSILHIDYCKIFVIPSAISDSLCIHTNNYTDVFSKYNLPKKYILSLSTLEPRKNLKLLVRAFSDVVYDVDYDLVLVGRIGWGVEELLSLVKDQNRIHAIGYVDDSDVAALYKNALCFVFPTAYEGFGLPPIEALHMGTPVISSNAASMPEVLRKQATFFESDSQDELKQLLLTIEETRPFMKKELDSYQKENYKFDTSALKIIKLLNNVY